MTVEFRLVQYCDDPARAEYKNFAVVIRDEENCDVRCVLPLNVEKASNQPLLPWLNVSNEDDVWVFEEWRQWLARLQKNYHRDPKGAWGRLDELERRGDKWKTSEGGSIARSRNEPFWEIASWVEDRVLGDPHWFATELKHAILRSELASHGGQRDFNTRIRGRTIFLSLYLREKPGLAVRGLQLRYRDNARLVAEVNDLFVTATALQGRTRNRILFVDDERRFERSIAKGLKDSWRVAPIYEDQPHLLLRRYAGF